MIALGEPMDTGAEGLEEAVGEGGGGRGVGEDGCVRTESRRSGIGRRGARVAEEEGQNNSTDEFEEFFDMIPLHEVSRYNTHTLTRARTHTHTNTNVLTYSTSAQ